MRKNLTTKTVILLSCLIITLTGCGKTDKPEVTPSDVPTQAPTATAMPTATPEPTATSAPTATPEPTATGTPVPTEVPAGPEISANQAKIESVVIRDEHTIVVTLNGTVKNANPDDISFTTYNMDWRNFNRRRQFFHYE